MVLPDSRRVSRAPRYLGYRFESVELSLTWLSPSLALLARRIQLAHGLVTLLTRPYNPRPCTRSLVLVATARFSVPWAVRRNESVQTHGTNSVPWLPKLPVQPRVSAVPISL